MKIDQRFHDKYHAPYGVIHRADMLNVILDACKKSNLIKLATSQKVVAIDDTGSGVTVKTETGETYHGRGADRLRRAVVHRAREDRRRRQAGRVRPHRLSRRAADQRVAGGIPPAQDDRLVRREDPSGALPAPPRRAVQPRRGVPLRPLRGGLGHLRRSGRAARALQGQVRAGAHAAATRSTPGRCGCCATARRSRTGPRAASRCWATPRIRCCSISRRAATWRWRMPSASPTRSRRTPGDYDAAFKKYQELRYLRTARVQLMARVFGEIYHASGVNRELRNKLLRRMERGRQHRHVVALRPPAGAAARRKHTDAGADAARFLINTSQNSSGRKTLMAKLDDLLEDLVTANHVLAKLRHRRFVRPHQHPPSGQAGPLLPVVLARPRTRQAGRHHRVQSRM